MEQTTFDFDYATLERSREQVKGLESEYFHAVTLKHTYAYFHKSSKSWRVQWKGAYGYKHIKNLSGENRKNEAIIVASTYNEMANFILRSNS